MGSPAAYFSLLTEQCLASVSKCITLFAIPRAWDGINSDSTHLGQRHDGVAAGAVGQSVSWVGLRPQVGHVCSEEAFKICQAFPGGWAR